MASASAPAGRLQRGLFLLPHRHRYQWQAATNEIIVHRATANARSGRRRYDEHHTPLITTLVVGIVLAFAFGMVAHRLRVSPLVGYLLAGVAVGPFTPGFVADQEVANEFAELGVILLMFGVGLHFSVADLLAVRRVAVPGAPSQMGRHTVGDGVIGRWAGRSAPASFSACRSPLRARSSCSAPSRSARNSTRERGRVAVAGWWSRTSPSCSPWCCCRRWRARSAGRRERAPRCRPPAATCRSRSC